MGYYTNYSLEWKPLQNAITGYRACEHEKQKGAKFCSECGASTAPISLDQKIGEYLKSVYEGGALSESGETVDAVKWYDHEKDMRSMSLVFKNVLFTLTGEGEEAGDIWKKYFLNGNIQTEKAKIVIGDFDADKLK